MSVTILGTELVWLLPVGTHELLELVRGLHATASQLRPMPCVELLLVRDAEMTTYNAQFMDCVGPTNILSFPEAPDTPEAPASLLLSVDTLRREACLYGESPHQYLLRLLAHGLGHVAGLDHGPDMDVFCDTLAKSQKINCAASENRKVQALPHLPFREPCGKTIHRT